LAVAAAFPPVTHAQCQHGVSTFKTCEGPKRSCGTNADCGDGSECTDDVCNTTLDNKTDCVLTLTHADTCGDRTKINEAFDVQDVGGDDVRVPAAGNLPIDSIVGNAVCCAGPAMPCFVAPAGDAGVIPNANTGCGNLPLPGAATPGSVSFRQNTYVIQPTDPNPLPDQGTFKVQDLCNAGAGGCSTVVNSVQFSASTDLVTGCENPFTPDSTPCTDTDGNLCTTAGCDGAGNCDQGHIPVVCPGDECAGQCNPGTGLCEPVQNSTPCTDVDGNPCTIAGCENGFCIQAHILPDSTPCPDIGNECATAGCDGAGNCDQNHVPEQDSTPCTDTDGNVCTLAGCDGLGTCDQRHQLPDSTPCPDTGDECASAGCDGAGNCDQSHVPEQDSTPCTDTDGDVCTSAGCDGLGTCDQRHQETCLPLNHFACYEAHADPAPILGIQLTDQFGPSTVDLRELRRLCAPVDKEGEDPTAPQDPEHLAGYTIKQTIPAPVTVPGQVIVNQFGTFTVDVKKAQYLLVPTAKSRSGAPAPLVDPQVDHFKCYKVTKGKFSRDGVATIDQFQTLNLSVRKPLRLCAPVDKNGEGILNPVTHLTCFKARDRSVSFQPPGTVFIDNQFTSLAEQPKTFNLFRVTELCVPSLKNPQATPTPSPTPS